jgi:uncharacterized membrane protein
MSKILSKLLDLRNLMILGLIIFLIGLIQSFIFGYAEWLNPGFLFLEEPMDKMSFGLILIGTSLVTSRFRKKYKISNINLGCFVIVFTIFVRLFWEVLWVTGSYYPSMYVSWSVLNHRLPIFAWQGNSELDYLTEAWNHFSIQFSFFAISFAALILVLLSILIEIKQKRFLISGEKLMI